MFINLTNSSPTHKGKAVALRADLVVSVYEGTAVREDGSTEDVTFIFVPPHGTWEVTEPHDEVLYRLSAVTAPIDDEI